MREEARNQRRLGATLGGVERFLAANRDLWPPEPPGLPTHDTVKSWIRQVARGSAVDRWDQWSAADDERARVLPVAAWLARRATSPEARWLTRDEGRWVDRVARAIPAAPPEVVFRVSFTGATMEARDHSEGLRELDIELVLYAAHPKRDMADLAEVQSWRQFGASSWVARAQAYQFPGGRWPLFFMVETADWQDDSGTEESGR